MRRETFVLVENAVHGDGVHVALEDTKEVVCDTRLLRSMGYKNLLPGDRISIEVRVWRDRPSIETDEIE